jgi:hypothetical protein
VSLQVGRVQCEGFQAVPESVVVVPVPRERATVLAGPDSEGTPSTTYRIQCACVRPDAYHLRFM